MLITHESKSPTVSPSAWVAQTAVLSGNVVIGENVRVMHGAVLTAEGDSNMTVSDECVIMEGAVLRSAGRFNLSVGKRCLIGPNAYLCGCKLDRNCFIATGAVIFNGSQLGAATTVAIGAKVHFNTTIGANSIVPMGFIAFGDPAKIYPPQDAGLVHEAMAKPSFMQYVFGVETEGKTRSQVMDAMMARYVAALATHASDLVAVDVGPEG
jgi:carbonic anhydrase/acetyltransferase-like protein (isoleucine patch superfamily)